MPKKYSLILSFIIMFCIAGTSISSANFYDTSSVEITPFNWHPISNIDNFIFQHENQKALTKRTIDQVKLGNEHYKSASNSLQNNDYTTAINEFKNALKRYKRAKLNDNSLNYVRLNLALSYASRNTKKDKILSQRFLKLLTKKVYKEEGWAYNIAITHYLLENNTEAIKLLNSCIKINKTDFQSYVTLEALYRSSGDTKNANKIAERMKIMQEKIAKKPNKKKKKINNKVASLPEGKKPDITNLNIIKKADHLKFNKESSMNERSLADVNSAISTYDEGVKALSNRDYQLAKNKLTEVEKKFKRAKISNHGLNFTRANLAIACLSVGDKRGVGQAKRYLKDITSKIYTSREWSYNMAITHYEYSQRITGTQQTIANEEAIRLFNLTIKLDKLFLPAYENLIFIYNQMRETDKAEKTFKAYEKSRTELMKSFSKQDQKSFGLKEPYIFRVNLGTFSEYNTPIEIFDEKHLITVPINNSKTTYIGGMFYNLDKAIEYQKKMKEQGFTSSFVVAYKNGEKLEF